jgi:hypothetical protein
VLAGRLTTGVVAAHKDAAPSGSGTQQLTGSGSPYASESYATDTNYIADTPSTGYASTGYEAGTTGYATTGTAGSVPPPPYGTPEGTTLPSTTAGWDDPATRTPGSGQL